MHVLISHAMMCSKHSHKKVNHVITHKIQLYLLEISPFSLLFNRSIRFGYYYGTDEKVSEGYYWCSFKAFIVCAFEGS